MNTNIPNLAYKQRQWISKALIFQGC